MKAEPEFLLWSKKFLRSENLQLALGMDNNTTQNSTLDEEEYMETSEGPPTSGKNPKKIFQNSKSMLRNTLGSLASWNQ